MLTLQKGMNFQTVLDVINRKREAIAIDLAELRADGVDVIDVAPHDLLALELAGYMIDVQTGVVLAGPRVLVL